MAGRVATSFLEKREHEFLNVLKKRGSKKAKKQKLYLISIHPNDEITPLTPSVKSPPPSTGHYVVFVDGVILQTPKLI